MRVVLNRVKEASVIVEDTKIGAIEHGYLLYVGLTHTDTQATVEHMAQKISNLRVMDDENGRLNKTVNDVEGSMLVVPNFTLYADTSSRRPGFKEAAAPDQAQQLFDSFVAQLIANEVKVEQGRFGAHMMVSSTNDGPVTIVFESN